MCMFGHKTIYKVTNLKSTPKGDIKIIKNYLFKNYNEQLVWTIKLFSVFVTTQIENPAYWNSTGWRVGENAWLSSACFKIETRCGVFIYHCISDGYQRFSENVGCNFNFILHIMSDKAAFVSGALLCTALPGKPRSLPLQQRLPLAVN